MQFSRLADYNAPQYKFNPSYFVNFLANNRKHQNEAIAAASIANIGQILSPCGTGKTRIQASIHLKNMIEKTLNGQIGVYVIGSHRLTLNYQLLEQILPLAIKSGLPFDCLFLGSGRPDLNKYYRDYFKFGYTSKVSKMISSINRKEIENFILKSKELRRHVIIASTYDSIDKLSNIGAIDLLTSDEAHNTTEHQFSLNLAEIKPITKKQYFFTATRKVRGKDGGMNDKKLYGEVLFDAYPHLMLKAGEITCPKFHIVSSVVKDKTTNSNNISMMIRNIKEAYLFHKIRLAEASLDSSQIAAKLLISCNGIDEMNKLYNHPEFKLFTKNNKIECFSIASEPEGCHYNWEHCGKEKFLNKLNEIPNQQEAIIFNVDMLTEGIDLPAITAVMPLRNMNSVKLFQLLGRCLRLHPADRKAIYAGILKPEDYSNYIKPYGSIIISKHLLSLSEHTIMIEDIKQIMNEYQTTAEELVIQDQFIDTEHDDLNTMISFTKTSGNQYDLAHNEMDAVSAATISQFNDELANLTKAEKIAYFEKMLENAE